MRHDSYDKNDILKRVHLDFIFSVPRFLDNSIHFVIFVMVIMISTPFPEKKDEKKLNSREKRVLVLNCRHDKIKYVMTKWTRFYDKIKALHDKIHGADMIAMPL